ncbi:MAG: heparinase II/III-family protein, partial [Phycisphaerae bacterium]|nr:heparinase II/III-family protein [Phycisphaerae bacterium]
RNKGKRILLSDAGYQIFADGSYIQHSFNYHRLMLYDCVWFARLAELHGETVGREFTGSVRRAAGFLREFLDPISGQVPNYGSNDGALILPLTSCDYMDFRPAAQAAAWQFEKRLVLPAGEHDELLFWLFGTDVPTGKHEKHEPHGRSYEVGGYFTLRSHDTWGMVRCHSYVERPSQADMLHLDLWRDGENVLRDAGSYKYYCAAPWQDYFKSTAAHNTIEVDGQNQMVKGPRFMWYEWCKARFIGRGTLPDDDGEWWEGEHYGYRDRLGVLHRRRIERRGTDEWTVIDKLLGDRDVSAMLRWRMVDRDYEFDEATRTVTMRLRSGSVQLSVTAREDVIAGACVRRGVANANVVEGWESLYYGEKRPIPVLCVDLRGQLPLTIETHICFPNA